MSTVTLKRQTDSLIRNLQESYIYQHVRESLRFKRTQKLFNHSLAYLQNRLLNSSSHRYRTEVATVVYSNENPVCHVTGPLVFIGQSGMTQPNPNCHVTGPLVFIGQNKSDAIRGYFRFDRWLPVFAVLKRTPGIQSNPLFTSGHLSAVATRIVV